MLTNIAFPIDLVYLWVDGSDPDFLSQKKYWFKREFGKKKICFNSGGIERFRNNNELRYALRSVAENVPWINHIYIVTGFNQVPKWLNTKNPKITIVPHKNILPKEALPTFNSSAILMGIANIPNLSEHFLLSDDDMFFNKKLSPSFFYDRRGRAKVQCCRFKTNFCFDEYRQTLVNAANYVKNICKKSVYKVRPAHGIDPYIKSSMLECISKDSANAIHTTIFNKFRSGSDVSRWVFNIYDYVNKRAVLNHVHSYKKRHFLDFIYNTIHFFGVRKSPMFCNNVTVAMPGIRLSSMFCINDSPDLNKTILKHNAEFLQKRFSNKSEFEL